jgi:hypothetical protein
MTRFRLNSEGSDSARRLGGWSRLGIVLTLLWGLVVAFELWNEFRLGPFSLLLLTDMRETGPTVLEPGAWVPVDQFINMQKLALTLLIPIISMSVLGFAWAWVREGFRKPKV